MQKIIVNMERVAKQIVPNLENLHIYPSNIEQIFTHENSNGYDIVTVAPIGDILTTTSVKSSEYQLIVDPQETFVGFSQVIVEPIVLQDKEITPTKDIQVVSYDENYDGLNEITINAIPSKFIDPQGEIEITENGEYNVREYSNAIIDVKPILQEKNVEIDINSSIDIVADDEYDGLSKVIVSNTQELEQKEITPTKETQVILPSENKLIDQVTINPIPNNYIDPSGEQEITENGNYNVREIESVNVNIQPNLGTKTITENGVYNASDDNLDGYSSVEVATSGADLSEYFNTNPTDITKNWVANNYILKVPDLIIPNHITSLDSLMENYTLPIMPKVICGNNVTDMSSMYQSNNNGNLKMTATSVDLSGLDTSNVYRMYQMFYQFSSLKSIDVSNFITNKLTNINGMFYSCSGLTELDLSSWNTSNLQDMGSFVNMCTSLTKLNTTGWDTSKVTNMSNAFSYTKMVNLDLSHFNTSNVTNMYQIFRLNTVLETLNISSFDFSKVTSISGAFASCGKLVNLTFGTNLGKGYKQKSANYSSYTLSLSYSTLLTHDSLMSVINNLYDLNLTYDVANGGTLYRQQLVLGATNLAKLTEDEIAIATNKGWTVS